MLPNVPLLLLWSQKNASRWAMGTSPLRDYGARDLAIRDKYQFQWWACSLVNAQPYQGKKKGADGGIDRLIYFADTQDESKKIIVSIKDGENVSDTMVKDLIAIVEHEKVLGAGSTTP